mmetsp:Transcript_13576/g.15230  ORF Transcript_13576/g.15230 Transcript_13576/m.15230 type:complete len:105 (-) Transcript_13576:8-322(-)
MYCIELCCVCVCDWTGLDWTGLCWSGSDWIRLDCGLWIAMLDNGCTVYRLVLCRDVVLCRVIIVCYCATPNRRQTAKVLLIPNRTNYTPLFLFSLSFSLSLSDI